ncbi:MFS monocarboxylate transporter [Rhodotorula toruloides]|uniref:BY PROTMAP: gi/472582219/gb/EMS19915.1/ MFS monocarboxylate transporter [Rhodosporidium toruloides NP11] gi/647399678/emb/CDR44583.1/ RHTO0S09e06634g1_1 [Rhodosporidium toruloides] n=1 Tax=Rhodotorula toruloides TaxID=5286 RepID=A0A0K3CJ71_RHOTO|nr:MFS monocarboxylate transporter [Rhodotorula toruloides]PRQ71656.1 Major facilitator superfamily domain-containing protein [Rhodotorula toruloides]
MAPLQDSHTRWAEDELTPPVSPAPSAAVSRTPTLVDLHAHGLAAARADGAKGLKDEQEEGIKTATHDGHHHQHHLPHLHLPPHPNQHLERYYPAEHYEATGEIEREKAEAQRRAAEGGADPEKAAEGETAATVTPGVDDYPDGGFKAWLVVAGAWCISFTAWGYPNGFGVLLSYWSRNQLSTYAESDIAWIGSFQIAANLFTAVLSGKAFDAGYCKHLLVAGLFVYTAGLFGLSYASTYWQIFLAQGLACGLASGLTFLPACSAVSHYFKKRRMLALGFLATGSSLGGVVYPSMMNKLLYQVGYGWTIRAVGFINLGLIVFACFAISSRLPPRPMGSITSFLDFGVFRGEANRAYRLYVLGASFVWLGLYTPLFYSEQYALFNGVRSNIAFYSLAMLNATSVFGRTLPNYFADQYGPLNLLIPATAVSGLMIFFWIPAMMNAAGVIVWSLLFGAFQGAFVAMLPAAIAALTEDMRTVGIRMAMAFLCQSFAALIGTPICGYVISYNAGRTGFIGAGILSGGEVLAGVVFIAFARFAAAKRKGTPWV